MVSQADRVTLRANGNGALTVYPWVANHDGPFRELKLGYLGQDTGIGQHDLLDGHNLFSVAIGMFVRTEQDIALNFALSQVHDGLVEFIL
jgi:hypothetical protein